MLFSDLIKRAIRQFLLIFALVIIILTILRQMYHPDLTFDLNSIYIIMGFSFVAALIEFIVYTPRNISENHMRLRLIVHFLSLEAILITLAAVIGIVKGLSDLLVLAIQIAMIYGILRLLSWRNDKRVSDQINERLKQFQRNLEN